MGRGFLKKNEDVDLSAGSWFARRTAAWRAGDRNSWCDIKTWAIPFSEIIYFNTAAFLHKIIVDYECDTVLLKGCILCLWLIQSQSQWGTGSSALHEGHPYGWVNTVLRHIWLQGINCKFSYFQHSLILHMYAVTRVFLFVFLFDRPRFTWTGLCQQNKTN